MQCPNSWEILDEEGRQGFLIVRQAKMSPSKSLEQGNTAAMKMKPSLLQTNTSLGVTITESMQPSKSHTLSNAKPIAENCNYES